MTKLNHFFYDTSLVDSRCSGSLVSYALGYSLTWQTITLIAIGPPIIAFCSFFFVPESPIQLIRQNKISSAQRAYKRLYGPNYDIQNHLAEAKLGLAQHEKDQWNSTYQVFKRPEIYKPFSIIVGLSLIQQFSGMSVLRSYVVKIFDEVFQNNSNGTNFDPHIEGDHVEQCSIAGEAFLAATMIGACRLVSSLMLSSLLYRFRRRTMYFWSAAMTVFSLFLFATCNYLLGEDRFEDVKALRWIALAGACTLVFGVQLGVQTMPLLMSGELFPSDVRPRCKSIARSIQCLLLVGCLQVKHNFQIVNSPIINFKTFRYV